MSDQTTAIQALLVEMNTIKGLADQVRGGLVLQTQKITTLSALVVTLEGQATPDLSGLKTGLDDLLLEMQGTVALLPSPESTSTAATSSTSTAAANTSASAAAGAPAPQAGDPGVVAAVPSSSETGAASAETAPSAIPISGPDVIPESIPPTETTPPAS